MSATKKRETRSPLKHKPLRNPGESLEEERQRLIEDKVMPPFLTVLVFIVFALWEWWRWFTKSPPQPVLMTLIAILAVAFCAYRIVKVVPQLRSLNLGLEGEKAVGQFLEAHRESGWHVFNDIPGDGFNIDHVLISPQGVFAVETKTFSKPKRGKAVVKYDGEKVRVNGWEPDRNPVVQARAARDWLGNLLFETTAMRYPVRGVVIFPGWYVESPQSGKRPDVWVLNEKALPKFIENEPVVLKDEDIALASSRLTNYVTQ